MKAHLLTIVIAAGAALAGGCGGGASPIAPTPMTPPVTSTPPPATPPSSPPPATPPPTPPPPTPPPPTTPPPTTPPPTTPTPDPPPPPPPTTPTVLRSARFEGANGYITDGRASVVRTGTSHTLELGDDFRTSQSSALDVRLCRDTRCSGDFVNLGPIQRFTGRQVYPLNNDGSGYRLAVIWCRAVGLPFGYGELR